MEVHPHCRIERYTLLQREGQDFDVKGSAARVKEELRHGNHHSQSTSPATPRTGRAAHFAENSRLPEWKICQVLCTGPANLPGTQGHAHGRNRTEPLFPVPTKKKHPRKRKYKEEVRRWPHSRFAGIVGETVHAQKHTHTYPPTHIHMYIQKELHACVYFYTYTQTNIP